MKEQKQTLRRSSLRTSYELLVVDNAVSDAPRGTERGCRPSSRARKRPTSDFSTMTSSPSAPPPSSTRSKRRASTESVSAILRPGTSICGRDSASSRASGWTGVLSTSRGSGTETSETTGIPAHPTGRCSRKRTGSACTASTSPTGSYASRTGTDCSPGATSAWETTGFTSRTAPAG